VRSAFWEGFRKGYIRAHIVAALAALPFMGACATYAPVAPPAEPPPVVAPPEAPPPVLPPPVVPGLPPLPVAEYVARLAVGSTEAEAAEVFGRPPDNVSPASGPAPLVHRWYVVDGGQKWAVHAAFRDGKVTSAGSARVVEVP
jgi:hypothetical protein